MSAAHRLLPTTFAAASAAAGAAVLILRPLPDGELPALALALPAIGLWATGVVPVHVTALAFFTVAMLFKVAPAAVVFAGFTSAALWLIFGGLVMGVAVRSTGLGLRIAERMAAAFGTGYLGVVGGVMCIGMTLGFVMPSSVGRVVLLVPIALSLAERFGFAPGSRGRLGLVLAAAIGCDAPTFSILPANVPNVVLVGAAETLWHISFTYGGYLLLHFPVLGLAKMLLAVALIDRLWPDRPCPPVARPGTPMSRDETTLAVLLTLALALWATDFAHHISPAWISMGAAVLLMAPLPRLGLVGQKAFNDQINYGSVFFVAGVMGLGAVVDRSGLGARLAGAILAVVPLAPGHPVANFAGLTAVSTLLGLVTTLPGVPAVLTPLAGQMAAASGLPLETVLNAQVLGFSNPLLPYESAPLVVAVSLGGERVAPLVKLCLLLALLTVLVLLPLDFLWWRLLGVI